jgi:hypothetical protein
MKEQSEKRVPTMMVHLPHSRLQQMGKEREIVPGFRVLRVWGPADLAVQTHKTRAIELCRLKAQQGTDTPQGKKTSRVVSQ